LHRIFYNHPSPLLGKERNIAPQLQFIHTLIDRAYNADAVVGIADCHCDFLHRDAAFA
jgi:hypothetical protein